MEEIIDMFADSVSQLVLLSVTLQEVNAKAPDQFGNFVYAVIQAAENMANTAKELANDYGAEYKVIQKELLDGSSAVETQTGVLEKALKTLTTSNKREEGWAQMVYACKGIAETTSRMLVLVNGVGQQRILCAAEDLLAALEVLKKYPPLTASDILNKQNNLITDCTDGTNKCAKFTKYVGMKATEIKDQYIKERVLGFFNELNQGNQRMVNATNGILQVPDDQASHDELVDSLAYLEDLVRRILTVTKPASNPFEIIDSIYSQFNTAVATQPTTAKIAQKFTVDDIVSVGAEAKQATQKVNGFESMSTDQLIASANQASKKLAKFAEAVESVNEGEKRVGLQQYLGEAYDEINRNNNNLVEAVNAYLQNPDEEEKQQLKTSIQMADATIDNVIESVNPKVAIRNATAFVEPNKSLEDAAKEAKIAVDKVASFEKQTPKVLNENVNIAADKVATLAAQLRMNATSTVSQELIDQMNSDADRLDTFNQELVDATNIYNKNANPENKKRLGQAVISLQSTIEQATVNSRPKAEVKIVSPLTETEASQLTIENIEESADDVKKAIQKVKQFNKLDPAQLVDASNLASKKLGKYAEQIRARAQKSNDPALKNKLLVTMQNLHDQNAQLVGAVNSYNGNRNPTNANNLTTVCTAIEKEIDSSIEKIKTPEGPLTFQDKIEAAADDILLGTMDSFAGDNMIALAKQIAGKLSDMAGAAREGNRQTLIKDAQDISNDVKKLIELAMEAYEACQDRQIRQHLMVGIDSLKNFSTQLKIISAVKGAMLGQHDETAETQLVACAQGLSKSITSTISATSAAKIRSKGVKNSSNTLLAVSKFKNVAVTKKN